MTIILSVLIFSSYIFTRENLIFYENLLGFIPAKPKIHSLVTYTFMHADIFHLAGNLIMLIIVGIAIERYVGKIPFLCIYISSGCVAAIFDILSRLLLGLSLNLPFIWASGSVFGLLATASLVRPSEKIPTFLIILSLFPIFNWLISLQIFQEMNLFNTLMIFSAVFIVIAILLLPPSLPVFVSMLIFLFSWIIFLLLKISINVSHIGHLGGIVGGILFMFVFKKEKKA